MDIYCPKCGEPIELDYLHDVARTAEMTFAEIYEDFMRRGCPAVDSSCSSIADHERADASAVLAQISDDCDEIAILMEDLFG